MSLRTSHSYRVDLIAGELVTKEQYEQLCTGTTYLAEYARSFGSVEALNAAADLYEQRVATTKAFARRVRDLHPFYRMYQTGATIAHKGARYRKLEGDEAKEAVLMHDAHLWLRHTQAPSRKANHRYGS